MGKYPDQLKTAINGTFDALVATLETRRAQLLKEAETSCTANIKKVWSQKEVVERAVVGLETTVGFTERVPQCSSDAEFLSLSPQASSRLKHLMGTKWDVETVGRLEDTKREFVGGNHTAYLQNIGQLRDVNIPVSIVVKGLSSSLPLGKKTEFTLANNSRRNLKITRPSVKVTYGFSKKGKRLAPVIRDGKWVVPFTPTCGGRHSLSVSVSGREVRGNPFKFTVEGVLSKGDRVIIGPDWDADDDDDSDDDGGFRNNTGTVEKHVLKDHTLSVKLDDGSKYVCKWGADGKYDVELFK